LAGDVRREGMFGTEVLRSGGRAAFRSMKRRPLQGIVVVGTLALAVGVNAALFSAARVLLHRELPYREADRVALVTGGSVTSLLPSLEGFQIDEEFLGIPGVESAACYSTNGSATLLGVDEATRVLITQVSPEFFEVMGVDLVLGPGIGVQEEGSSVAVISYGLWHRLFAGDPGVLGLDLQLNGHTARVVGVTPPEVSFPGDTQIWLS